MAVQLPSAAPTNALKVWTDGLRIFTDIGGYVVAFPLTEGGLSKVLNLLRERRVDYSGQPMLAPPPKPKSDRQSQAEALLLRLGVIKR